MWVFSGESLVRRLELDERLGWWLDYWLFLNSEETHPIWSTRPLGAKALARAVLASDAPSDWTLRTQLKREVEAVAKMSASVPTIPTPPVESLIVDGSNLVGPWLQWIRAIDTDSEATGIVQDICLALASALTDSRFQEVMYLTRHLASELSSAEWSGRQLFMTAKHAFCDSGSWANRNLEKDSFAETLGALFVVPLRRTYRVVFNVSPVYVTTEIIKTVGRGQRLILEDDDGRQRLTGIRSRTFAAHPEQAAIKSHRVATRILERLRLSFYVRTNLYGAVKVTDEVTNVESWIPLPQPFWTKGINRREVPGLPPGRFLEAMKLLAPHDAARWHATRWHLSQAFADWAEDVHSAAAKIWQALEAFAPGNQKGFVRVQNASHQYLALIAEDIAEHLATKLTSQARALNDLWGGESTRPDWYYWNSRAQPLHKWVAKVLDTRSPKNWQQWRDPTAPRLLFGQDVGLLVLISRRLKRPNSEQWMERRLENDLTLLYGLRNKIVHSGQRVLPDRMATYLASVGAEIIFTLMAAWAIGLKKGISFTEIIGEGDEMKPEENGEKANAEEKRDA
jgi:hypothetical protein